MSIDMLLYVLAFVCFMLAAFKVVSKLDFFPLGFALLVLTLIV